MLRTNIFTCIFVFGVLLLFLATTGVNAWANSFFYGYSDHLTVDYKATGISDGLRRQAQVATLEEARNAMKHIGYPAMLKASEGGGGKGIRKVTKEEELEAAFRCVILIMLIRMLFDCSYHNPFSHRTDKSLTKFEGLRYLS